MRLPAGTNIISRSVVILMVLAASLFLFSFNSSFSNQSRDFSSDKTTDFALTMMSGIQYTVVDEADSSEPQNDDTDGEFIQQPAEINSIVLDSESEARRYRQPLPPDSLNLRGPPQTTSLE